MTTGDVLSYVVIGFAFIWAADTLRLWAQLDAWLESRGLGPRSISLPRPRWTLLRRITRRA